MYHMRAYISSMHLTQLLRLEGVKPIDRLMLIYLIAASGPDGITELHQTELATELESNVPHLLSRFKVLEGLGLLEIMRPKAGSHRRQQFKVNLERVAQLGGVVE